MAPGALRTPARRRPNDIRRDGTVQCSRTPETDDATIYIVWRSNRMDSVLHRSVAPNHLQRGGDPPPYDLKQGDRWRSESHVVRFERNIPGSAREASTAMAIELQGALHSIHLPTIPQQASSTPMHVTNVPRQPVSMTKSPAAGGTTKRALPLVDATHVLVSVIVEGRRGPTKRPSKQRERLQETDSASRVRAQTRVENGAMQAYLSSSTQSAVRHKGAPSSSSWRHKER